MEPLLPDGTFALFSRVGTYKEADTILIHHAEYGLIVKEVCEVLPDGFRVAGTSPYSTPSYRFGIVPPERVIGRLCWSRQKKK